MYMQPSASPFDTYIISLMYFKTTKDNNYFNNNYVIYNYNYVIYNYNYVIIIAHKCPYLQYPPQSAHQGRMLIDLQVQHLGSGS